MHKQHDWIQSIEEGMDVYDANGDKVGTVESFQFGTEGETETVPDSQDESLVEAVAEVFTPGEFPEEVRSRLLQEGFIRIDKGILQGYGYVPNSKIRTVNEDGIYLSINHDGILVRQ